MTPTKSINRRNLTGPTKVLKNKIAHTALADRSEACRLMNGVGLNAS